MADFPWFNMQQINLDWLLGKIKHILPFLPDNGSVGQILRRTSTGAVWSDEVTGSGLLQLTSFSELYSNKFAKYQFLAGSNISATEVVSGIHDAYFRFDPTKPFVWGNKDSWETGYYDNGWIYASRTAIIFNGFKNVVFDGLSFVADIDDQDVLTWTAIRLENCENVTFTNCHIEGFKWCGIDISSVSNKNIRIENCYLRRCRFKIFDAGENTSIIGNTITDDYSSTQECIDNGGVWKSDSSKDSLFYDGVLESGVGCLIANNTIYECGQSGIYSSSCSFFSVIGNDVHENFNGGIDLGSTATDYGLHDISICGNTIYANHNMGINLTNLKNAQVTANRSQSNGGACIVLEGNTKDSYIVGNYCYSVDQTGVSVGLSVSDCSIIDTVGFSSVELVRIPEAAKSNGVKAFFYNTADYPFLTVSVPNSDNALDARNVMELSVDDSQPLQYWIANKPIVLATDKSGTTKQTIHCGALNPTAITAASIWLTSFIRLPQAKFTATGAIWFDPADNKLKYYDGTNTHVVANES